MSSTFDMYQPCLCGSGKKLKFCCAAIVADMEKVRRLQEGKQQLTAFQTLEQVEKKAPRNAWVLMTKAQFLLTEGRIVDAKSTLETLLQEHPEHGEGSLLYAHCCYSTEGYEASLSAIQRALHRASHNPELAALLVLQISEEQGLKGKFLSARQYLTLGLRWVQENMRQRVFYRLMEMETDRSIPYPFRSVHQLEGWQPGDEPSREFSKAGRLALIGCWEAAGRLFTSLAEQNPTSSALWQNAALCRAWRGDELGAAAAFHEAALQQSDHEAAVECETLSQLLNSSAKPSDVTYLEKSFTTPSVSRLLTRLSQQTLLPRDDFERDEADPDAEGRPLSEIFEIIDRAAVTPEQAVACEVGELPRVIGNVRVFDAVPEKDLPPSIVIQAVESSFADAEAILTAAGGEELQPLEGEPKRIDSGLPRELSGLQKPHWLPSEGIAIKDRKRLAHQRLEQFVANGWANAPLEALGGKSPREAIGDASLIVPLSAAIYVLDALLQQRSFLIDVPKLCADYQVPQPTVIRPEPDVEMQGFTAMQLHRVDVGALTDDQLKNALNRAMLIAHQRFLNDLLQEAVRREALHSDIDLPKVFEGLVGIARTLNRRDDAKQWARRGIEAVRARPDSFEDQMKLELNELVLYCEDPADPAIPDLMRQFHARYARKDPRVESVLAQLCDIYGVTSLPDLQSGGAGQLVGAGSTSAGGVWTPESNPPSGGAGKLWLPGQE